MLVQIERGGSGTSSPPISRGSNRWPSPTLKSWKQTNTNLTNMIQQFMVAFGSAVSFYPFQCMPLLLVLFENFMDLGLIFAYQRLSPGYHWIFHVSTLLWALVRLSGSKWFEAKLHHSSSELSSSINIYRLPAQTLLCLLATDYYRLLWLSGKTIAVSGKTWILWGNPTKILSRI